MNDMSINFNLFIFLAGFGLLVHNDSVQPPPLRVTLNCNPDNQISYLNLKLKGQRRLAPRSLLPTKEPH
jgi:hypothetical protein